jgi:hypothetical protein
VKVIDTSYDAPLLSEWWKRNWHATEVTDIHVGAGSNLLSFGRFQNVEGFAAALA